MKSLLADILFWLGDKLSLHDNRVSAYLYVKFMQWSDRLKPWPNINDEEE